MGASILFGREKPKSPKEIVVHYGYFKNYKAAARYMFANNSRFGAQIASWKIGSKKAFDEIIGLSSEQLFKPPYDICKTHLTWVNDLK